MAAVTTLACASEFVSLGYDVPAENRGLMPNGPVFSCTGRGCPYGECDNAEFFSDVDCDDVYPGPVDGEALFCQPSEEGDYCVDVGEDQLSTEIWVVQCGGGVASAERCGRGCRTSNATAECL